MSVFCEIMSPIRTRRMSAVSPRRGQSSGAIPIARRVRNVQLTATRIMASVGAAVLAVLATVVLVLVSTVSSQVQLSASTALIMGGTTIPTPDDAFVALVKNQYITPTHPGQDMEYVVVTTPEEAGPVTGLLRLAGRATGSRLWAPGGPGWPDEPWWKLSGLFGLTLDQSMQAGLADLEQAMAEHGNDHLVINGFSQGSMIATMEKRKLAEQYPPGTDAPDIDFVLEGTQNLPNGGLVSRFPGLYIPIVDWYFNGPAPTDTQFDTVVINTQYDGFSDAPLYPINLVADWNAVLGAFYLHFGLLDDSLAPAPDLSTSYQGTHGDTTYYMSETRDLPLFTPLRSLGVP